MKKSLKIANRSLMTFGDLILAVSSFSRNANETAATVTDLIESGRVCLTMNGRALRARVT